ncbi:MAG: sigma 54-interacting transcriptional regulator [Thermodesulfobacteriota bacterium]
MLQEGYAGLCEKVIDTMMEGVVVVDPRGVILSVNRALEEITGYQRQELIGRPCSLIKSDACFSTLNSGGKRQCELFQTGSIRRCKCILAKKDGSLVHVMKNATLLKDSDGRLLGAVETLTDVSEMVAQERVITRLRRELSREDGFHGILGKSPKMLQLFSLIDSAAQSDAPVIIYGESGTGKELVAGAIHRLSPRSQGPFIKVSSVALHESLLESELFGHVKGAFTGADRSRVGRFEAAHGGDIFLDEIGDLSMNTQAKLLRVLQEKVIEKVGDQKPVPVEVRVITATNKDLQHLMAEARFREDLYYRINVIPIHLPPLRERREDIPLLTEAFIERLRLKTRKPISGISKEAMETFLQYRWPGNVRELLNSLEYAFVLCREGDILPPHLPAPLAQKPVHSSRTLRNRGPAGKVDDKESLLRAMEEAGGNKSAAARLLGVSRVTIWKKLKQHNL